MPGAYGDDGALGGGDQLLSAGAEQEAGQSTVAAAAEHQHLRALRGPQQSRNRGVRQHLHGEREPGVVVGELGLGLLQDLLGAAGFDAAVLDDRGGERLPLPGVDDVDAQVAERGFPRGPVGRGPALGGTIHSDDEGAFHGSVFRADARGHRDRPAGRWSAGGAGRGKDRASAGFAFPGRAGARKDRPAPARRPVLPSRPGPRPVSRRPAPCAYQVTDAQRWLGPSVSRCLR